MGKEFYLKDYIKADAVFEMASAEKEEVLKEISEKALQLGCISSKEDSEKLFKKLLERESLGSTAIIPHIAIPHCKIDFITEDMFILVGYSASGVNFSSHDKKAVNLFFTVLTRKNMPTKHLSALAAISRMISNYSISTNIEKYTDKKALQEIIDEFVYRI